jgi:hypothetical protein
MLVCLFVLGFAASCLFLFVSLPACLVCLHVTYFLLG